jgi:hypothetical protein
MAAGQGFASMPESQHRLASAVGSLRRWSRVNSANARTEALAPARNAMRKRWEAEADPDGVLPPEELDAAVKRLRTAHMRRMALASAQKRATKAA